MAILAWRLGLGWLVGRRMVLLTTSQRRVVVPFRQFAGTFYLRKDGSAWVDDLAASPAVTIQAWPGPRSVRARTLESTQERRLVTELWGDDSEVVALSPTGQRTPDMTTPDLVWVWPLLALLMVARRILGSS